TMADVNVNAPAEQAPAMTPPTRTDDQILPRNSWVPVGKSNCYLDIEKSQSNLIYKIAVDILKHTNFFRAFTASSTILSIYIQQFWDNITPINNDKPFSSPPTPDALINCVNDLGYPKPVRTLSAVMTNDMHQPWRALTMIINLCLTRKTSGFERPRASVLLILWGVINQTHIDYAERMWEEFIQSIHSFIEDKKNLALHTQEKKKVNPLVIPSVRFTKLIIHHLQSKHKFHPRPDSQLHFPYEEYVLGYLKFSAKGTKQYLAGEEVSDPDSPAPKPAKATIPKATKQSKPLAPKAAPVTKPAAAKAPMTTTSQPPTPTLATTEPSKKDQIKKRKLVKESSEAPSPAKRPKAGKVIKKFGDEEDDMQKAVEESLKDVHAAHQGPLPLVVIREPEFGKFQPLLMVKGKGKEKVSEEQAAQVLLNPSSLKTAALAKYTAWMTIDTRLKPSI
ncbi:hypothetical protein Tco_1388510, partial [Tanacetum coccineum]